MTASMRTITDKMARLLAQAPISGVSSMAWEVASVLAEYDAAKRAEEVPSCKPSGQAPAPGPDRGRSALCTASHAARRAEP